MSKKLDLYILVTAVLAIGAYLRSPVSIVCAVLLWGVAAAEAILTRSNKDADIAVLVARAEAYEKKLKTLEADLSNVSERARTILGETF